jgi:hypothetical protein
MSAMVEAARLIVALDKKGDEDGTRGRKARIRFGGALSVWEIMTGKDLDYAYAVVERANAPVLGMHVPAPVCSCSNEERTVQGTLAAHYREVHGRSL